MVSRWLQADVYAPSCVCSEMALPMRVIPGTVMMVMVMAVVMVAGRRR